MSQINHLSLKVFAEILRSGSFDAAAKRMHLTPSAVSQRIRQLEDQLGQLLIIRTTPSRPTAAGALLYRHAQQVELLEEDLLNQLEQTHGGKLAVAVNTDSMDGWFMDAIAAAAESNIMLNVKVEDQAFSETLLREGKVMAAVSTHAKPMQGCSSEHLGTMFYSACASQAFYQTHFRTDDPLKDLSAATSLFFNEKDGLQQAFLQSITGRDDIQPPTIYIPSNKAYIDAILRGIGWGMLPDYISEQPQFQDKFVKLYPAFSIAIDLYWIRWNTRMSTLDTLSQYVRNAAEKSLNKKSEITNKP